MARSLRWWIIGASIGTAGLTLIIATSSSVPSSIASAANAPVPTERPQAVIDSDDLLAAPPRSESSEETAASPADRLAALSAGASMEAGDPRVLRFRSLLRTTALQVPEREPEIADLTVRAWRTLQETYGIEIGLLELMERANGSVYSLTGVGRSYAELTARLVAQLGGH